MIIPFEACSTITIAAPSNSGKTTFVYNLLKTENSFTIPITRIIYHYGVYQPLYDKMKNEFENIDFIEGLPTSLHEKTKHTVLVIDDLMEPFINSSEAQKLVTQTAHHHCTTIIFITHNCFAQGRYARTIALNSTYLILFKSFRDGQQIVNLGKQMFPGNGNILVEAYKDATNVKYNPLVIDMSPHTDDKYRLRSNIFNDMWIYIPK